MKNCIVCHHLIRMCGSSHDYCRSHAPCARGGQYYAAKCPTCEELWQTAADSDSPSAAIEAFHSLRHWIRGFVKNSKAREPGKDIFVDPAERMDFLELEILIRNIADIPSLDLPPPPPPVSSQHSSRSRLVKSTPTSVPSSLAAPKSQDSLPPLRDQSSDWFIFQSSPSRLSNKEEPTQDPLQLSAHINMYEDLASLPPEPVVILFEDPPSVEPSSLADPRSQGLASESSPPPVLRMEFTSPLPTPTPAGRSCRSSPLISPQQPLSSPRGLPPLVEPVVVDLADSFSPVSQVDAQESETIPQVQQVSQEDVPIASPSLSLLNKDKDLLSSISALLDSKLSKVINEVKELTDRVGLIEKQSFTGFTEGSTLDSARRLEGIKKILNSPKGILVHSSDSLDQHKRSRSSPPAMVSRGADEDIRRDKMPSPVQVGRGIIQEEVEISSPPGSHGQAPFSPNSHPSPYQDDFSVPQDSTSFQPVQDDDSMNNDSSKADNEKSSQDSSEGIGKGNKGTGVSFASPQITPSTSDTIPDGWSVLKDGEALGETPGSIVFEDGSSFGPQTIELDLVSFKKPIWRYRTVKGAKPRAEKGVIPVREAFESLLSALSPSPMAAKEWDQPQFPPCGSKVNRAFSVGLDDSSLIGGFLEQVPSWFQELAQYHKPSWEEAISPTNIIPDSLSFLSAKDFVALFGKKQFAFNETNQYFDAIKLPNLPSDMIQEEYGARMNFLNCLNVSLAAEALMLQWGKEEVATPAVSGILKLSLPPLWTAFALFAKKKSELRKRALKGCNVESPHYLRLVNSNPFSERLFAQEAIDAVKEQALHQSKPVSVLLNYKQWARKREPSSRSRSAKRPKTSGPPSFSTQRSPGGQQQRSPVRRAGNFSNSFQGNPSYSFAYHESDNQRQFHSQRRSPAPSRGRGFRQQSGRGRSQASPRRQGSQVKPQF